MLDFFFLFIYFYSRDVIFISGEISWQWRLISKAFMLAAISLHLHKTSTVKSLGLIYNQKMIAVLCFFLKNIFFTQMFFFPLRTLLPSWLWVGEEVSVVGKAEA